MSKPVSNIKLIIAYDGRSFLGWQETKEGPSIERSLRLALEQILQEKPILQAASRTDAGVHARGQVVNFFTSKMITANKLQLALNSLLPKEIAILKAEETLFAFHPTLDSKGKEYHYEVCYGHVQLPQNRCFSWHFPFDLNLNAMRQAAKFLEGRHDFAAFCNFLKNSSYQDTVREVQQIIIEELPKERLLIKIRGNHFLYKMVRNLVGTLVYVGKGKITPEEIPLILKSCNRKKAGVSAPAHGLCLQEVFY